MVKATFVGSLAKLNEHDNANRTNWRVGANLKKSMTEMIAGQCKGIPPITAPIRPSFVWYISSKHDPDNISFAKKYILDGMQEAGILPKDNQEWILGFGGEDFVRVAKGEEKVEVSW